MRVIVIVKKGSTGQPASAQLLADDLLRHDIESVFKYISTPKLLISRVFISIKVLFFLLFSKNNVICHLGLESLLFHLFFKSKKIIFINHGLIDYGFRETIRLKLYKYIMTKSKLRGNKIYFADKDFAEQFDDFCYYQNRIDISNLKYEKKDFLSSDLKIGFVGEGYQKNINVLDLMIMKNERLNFYHMSKNKNDNFLKYVNYHYLESSQRVDFFKNIDVLLIPSLYESYCLVAREATYSGAVVIHSGHGGLKYFKDGFNINGVTRSDWDFDILDFLRKHAPNYTIINEMNFLKEDQYFRNLLLKDINDYVQS